MPQSLASAIDGKTSATAKPVTVLIVDDHQIVREGLNAILGEDPAIQIIGEAADGIEGIEEALRLQPDVVLMDVQMPKMTGIEAAAQLKTLLPAARVVMLTMYSNDMYLVEAVRAGAVSYVLKDASRELLCETIKSAYAGHILIRSDMLRQALTGLVNNPAHTNSPNNQLHNLSDREIEVLKLVTEGYSNREIGTTLFISEGTVKKHIQSIITKLGAIDRTQAAVKAVRAGLVK
ncbi:MAG: response regulator transcription factor [Chloroflexota bacterium]|nr:response regulator transcription factor [Chloroflexota bacterium]